MCYPQILRRPRHSVPTFSGEVAHVRVRGAPYSTCYNPYLLWHLTPLSRAELTTAPVFPSSPIPSAKTQLGCEILGAIDFRCRGNSP